MEVSSNFSSSAESIINNILSGEEEVETKFQEINLHASVTKPEPVNTYWKVDDSGQHVLVIELILEDQSQAFTAALSGKFIGIAAKILIRADLLSKVKSRVKFDKAQDAQIGRIGACYSCTLSDTEYEKEIQTGTWKIVDMVPKEKIVYEVLTEATDIHSEGRTSIPEKLHANWSIEIKTLANQNCQCKLELNDERINIVFAERFASPPFNILSCASFSNGMKQRVRRKYLKNVKPKAELIAAYFKDQFSFVSYPSTQSLLSI